MFGNDTPANHAGSVGRATNSLTATQSVSADARPEMSSWLENYRVLEQMSSLPNDCHLPRHRISVNGVHDASVERQAKPAVHQTATYSVLNSTACL